MYNLSEELKKTAVSLGMCKEHIAKWDHNTPTELLMHYASMPEWCFEHNFPSKQLLLDKFSQEDINTCGIYIDQDMSNRVLPSDIIILHDCTGVLSVSNYEVLRVYLFGNSDIEFVVDKNACLAIDCYNDSSLKVDSNDNAKCLIYQYGQNMITIVNDNDKIKLIDKRWQEKQV